MFSAADPSFFATENINGLATKHEQASSALACARLRKEAPPPSGTGQRGKVRQRGHGESPPWPAIIVAWEICLSLTYMLAKRPQRGAEAVLLPLTPTDWTAVRSEAQSRFLARRFVPKRTIGAGRPARRGNVIKFQHRRKINCGLIRNTPVPIAIHTSRESSRWL
jgi:hypothetical protein